MNRNWSALVTVLGVGVLGAVLVGNYAWAQPRAVETGFVQVEEDVQLFYQRFGRGRPTVFVPNRHELIHAFAPLFEKYDVVTWDPRGRGLSSRPEDFGRYGVEAEISDAEALREHFGVGRVTYVGVSLWGNIGMLYAARHPGSVERVISLGPLPIRASLMGPPDDPVSYELPDHRRELDRMRLEGAHLHDPHGYCELRMYISFADSYGDLRNMAPFTDANLCQYANEHPDRIEPVIFEGIFASFGAWDWSDEVRRIEAPVLIAFGGRENWPLAGVRAYGRTGPDIGLVEVPSSGHHVWNDAANTTWSMMDTFLRGDWPEGVRQDRATRTDGGTRLF